MKQLEYKVSYPADMVIRNEYGSPYKVAMLIDILTPIDYHDDVPKRIAIIDCDQCGVTEVILFGDRGDGEWQVNWNVSRPLANILMPLLVPKIGKEQWISVDDRLPDGVRTVFVVFETGGYETQASWLPSFLRKALQDCR